MGIMLKDIYNDKTKYDELTNLPLTALFKKNAVEYFDRAYGQGSTPVMIFFDLNGIRPFIARYGADDGNRLIKEFSDLLRKYFGNEHSCRTDTFCFYAFTDQKGEDEFLPKIIKDMEARGGDERIVVKTGVFNGYVKGTDTIEGICDKAMFACRNSRISNSSGISYFDHRMDDELLMRSYITDNIDEAIRNGRIKVFYQPKIRLLNDKFCGAEALTRFETKDRGTLLPSVYIPILEENNLTWKLDTYVIREAAKDMRRIIDMGYDSLPVSVNLTYDDFLVLNVPDTISVIARDNGIDHSLIVIEITEKTILKNPEFLREEIEKLHNMHFKVIIDDFGNGYSSLNMLSNFRFDAIKIDMELMRNFTERNKKIVESIVVMAKNLGIHTISEGVENREHLDFLRSIGCESVQGYYYGKPASLEDIIQSYKNSWWIERETPGESELFEKAGLINLNVGQAMALSYYDGSSFDVFFANNEFYNLIARTGHDPRTVLMETANAVGTDVSKRFRDTADRIGNEGVSEDLEFYYGGMHYVLDNRLISSNAAGCIFQCFLHVAESIDDEPGINDDESLLKSLIPSYDNIYYVDLSENTLRILKAEYGFGTVGSSYNYELTIADFVNSGVVFSPDADRFLQTFDKKSLSKRVAINSGKSFLTLFRIKINEVFKWVTFRCSEVPESNGNRILFCITVVERETQGEFVDMARTVLNYMPGDVKGPDFSEKDAEDMIKSDFLWNSLMDISDVRYFWKDRDRRFLGASKSFLEFYGFNSLQEILGRSDEEMGWHPDDTQYRSDELEILEKGVVIRNSPGQIYAKGAKVNILATKYPLYKNGEIVGLIGYFIDSDIVLTADEEMDHALYVDINTGLLNSRGLFLTLQGMDDNYRNNGTLYGAAMFEVAEYQRIHAAYGKDTAEEFLQNVGNTIKRAFPAGAVTAKTLSCGFTVCVKGKDCQNLKDTIEDCIEKIQAISPDKNLSLTISTAFILGDEKPSFHEVFTLLLYRFNEDREKNHVDLESIDSLGEIPDIYKDIPLPFMILRPSVALNGVTDVRYVFVNNKYCEYSGLSRIDILGKSYKKCFDDNSPDWMDYTGRAANGETVTGRVFEISFGQWMDYIATPSSIPGCCNIVFWPVEDSKKEREFLTKGHEADNAIIRIARFLNTAGALESGIYKSLAELGRVMKPDRVYMLDTDGNAMYEWCSEGVTPRSGISSDYTGFDINRMRTAILTENCVVVDNLELMRKANPKAYEFLTWEGIRSFIIVPLYDSSMDIMGFLGMDNFNTEDISTTRRILEEVSYFISSKMTLTHLLNQLHLLSNRDELTGLLNRHGFRSEIDNYLDEHPDDPFTLILIDVDDFKIVNDMYGHATGDDVLRNLAGDLNSVFSNNALLARTGGDELSVALKGYTAKEALPLIKELSESPHSFVFEEKTYPFRLSIGFAEYPAQADNMSMLLKLADSALYNVKSEGKHGCRQYTSDIKITKRLQLAFNIKNVARYIPGAILVYMADDDKKILYANEELITMFECDNLEDFMEYTGGTFDGIVHPEEIQAVDDAIWKQIDKGINCCKDYVDYRIVTKKNNIKEVIDCGRFVNSDFYGQVFYVMLLDKDEWRRSKGI